MSNSKYWDAMRTPPKGALKKISFGNLKGKSDINPQWRMQVMTETFGPCGIGWKYEKVKEWTIAGPHETVAAFVDVNLYISDSEKTWSEPIPGTGGSMLIVKDKNGLHMNDEAFKMATTDALSVAMKQVGVAADIYMGIMDGSKYQTPRNVLSQPQQSDVDAKIQAEDLMAKHPEMIQDLKEWCEKTMPTPNGPQTVIAELNKQGMK